MNELRLALRRLRRRPTRGVAITLTLGIGLGATTAAFTAVDAVLLRDLPVRDQDELVVVWRLDPERGSIALPFRAPEYDAVARGAASLSEVAGVSAWGGLPVPVGDGGETGVLAQARIVGDFFGVLGVTPTIGRLPDETDDRPGAEAVGVLSHSAWRSRYASDPGVVGRVLSVDRDPVTVVGVAPEGFDFPHGTELWTPLRHDFAGDPGFVELHVVGRMAGGVDPSTVGSDVAATLAAAPTTPDGTEAWLPVVRGLDEHLRGAVRPLARAGLAAAVLLLLAAGANATLLLLAGGRGAARDLAIRRALGADRARALVRWIADATVVGVAGLVVGLLVAWIAVRLLVPLVPPEIPRLDLVALDGRAAGFAGALALALTLVTAGCATFAASRKDAANLLSGGARDGHGRNVGARRSVAALQVGLTVVSAIGAGLLMRTVWAMDRLDVGMAAEEITAVTLRAPYTWFEVPESYFAALEAVSSDLEARPGIVAARPSLGPPLQQRLEAVLVAEEQDPGAVEENPYVAIDAVLPGHLQAMGIPLLAGRGITPSDNRSDAEPVVVVDEVLADALWPGMEAVGRRLSGFGPDPGWYEVVGVASATRYREYLRPHPRAYFPLRRLGNAPPTALLVRHDPTAPPPVERLVREAFENADPAVRVMEARTLSDAVRAPTMDRRFAAGVLTAFAGATILLALLGVYGVFTVSVQERVREMGVRRALGARRSSIMTLVLSGILRVAAVGAALGLVASVWTGRLVESLLFGVEPLDAPTFLVVAAGSVLVAVCAGLPPALRASTTDPVVSLRSE